VPLRGDAIAIEELRALADSVLASTSAPATRLFIHRHVQRLPSDAAEIVAARHALRRTRLVREITDAQQRNGGWGRFHSRNTRTRRAVDTTEFAVRRLHALGLGSRSHALVRARAHCVALLAGQQPFPDPSERNDRWPTGWRLFAAATLALIAPRDRHAVRIASLWRDILEQTFADGRYDADREVAAHNALTGASVADTYLRLHNRYAIELLGSCSESIAPRTLAAYLDWLCGGTHLIYLDVALDAPPVNIDAWLSAWELVARYPDWHTRAQPLIAFLAANRTPVGLWDFGTRPRGSHVLPLANDWRDRRHRTADWSARVLRLLTAATLATPIQVG